MKVDFEEVWTDDMVNLLTRYATGSLGYHDGQDAISEFAYYVWTKCTSKDDWQDVDHARHYIRHIFRYRLISYGKRRATRDRIEKEYQNHVRHRRFAFIDTSWVSLELISSKVEITEELKLYIYGYSMADIATLRKSSIATVSRRIKHARTQIKRLIEEDNRRRSENLRVEIEEDLIDLNSLPDFPDTLERWTEMCGGPGYCLGGSGITIPEGHKYYPGYKMKLVYAMARIDTRNAHLLASQMGLSKKVDKQKERIARRRGQ